VIALVTCTPSTVAEKTPLFASVNVKVALPTAFACTCALSNDAEAYDGPVVR
jgi:hypothetical protein